MQLRRLRSLLHHRLTGRPRPSLNPFRAPGEPLWAAGAVLCRAPLVIATSQNGDTPLGLATILGSDLADSDVLFLVFLTWSHEGRIAAWKLAERIRYYRMRHPKHRFLILANTAGEVERFVEEGADAVLANHNIFADETVFRPIEGAAPLYDALLNAKMVPMKRHHLASEAGRLALIYYRDGSLGEAETDRYFASVRAALPNATFVNEEGGERFGWLSQASVNLWLNRAAIGLALSAVEGANFASIEYLLAGMPVVSTVSRGGRDRYFDAADCIVCEADPRQVGEAVRALRARQIPREAVRRRVLALVERDRADLHRSISERLASGAKQPPVIDMLALRRLPKWRRAADLEKEIRAELADILTASRVSAARAAPMGST